MSHTHELRVHRRTHRLKQDELAHLIGVSPSMVLRMEQGARAQLADIEAILGLEFVFGKAPSEIFAALYTAVEEAVMCRAAELHAVWETLDEPKAHAKVALLEEMARRAKPSHNAV